MLTDAADEGVARVGMEVSGSMKAFDDDADDVANLACCEVEVDRMGTPGLGGTFSSLIITVGAAAAVSPASSSPVPVTRGLAVDGGVRVKPEKRPFGTQPPHPSRMFSSPVGRWCMMGVDRFSQLELR